MYYCTVSLKLSSKRSNFYSFLLVVFLSAAFFIMPKIAKAQVVINEIMYDLSGADDKHEWVELYNAGGLPIDLTGWKINDGDNETNHALNAPPKNSGRGSLILPAGSYLLLADDAATLITDLQNYSGPVIDTVLGLLNTTAILKLIDQDGAEMMAVAYNKTLGAAGNNRTLEWDGTTLKESLADGGTPGQANSVLTPENTTTPSVTLSNSPVPTSLTTPSASPLPTTINDNNTPTATPAPATPSPSYSQQIFINEFLPWPNGEEKEWVELINSGSTTVTLDDWQIDDENLNTSAQKIPSETTLAPGEFLVVTFNKNILNNDGDQVRLLWPNGQTTHSVAYTQAAQGQTVAKFNSEWLWTNQPTPGQTNKKFFADQIKTTPLPSAPVASYQILKEQTATRPPTSSPVSNPSLTVLENTLAALTEAVGPADRATNQTASPIPSTALATINSLPPAQSNAPVVNLLAAVSEPTDTVKNNSYLALVGVLFLAAISAGGLIYFRRLSKPVDDSSLDD